MAMSLAACLHEAFEAFRAADGEHRAVQRNRNPGPYDVARATEVRAAATAALDRVVVSLQQEEVLILHTLEQARAFTQFLPQFPEYGNLRRVQIAAGVHERTATRMRHTLRMAGFGAPTLTFYFPD